MKAKTTKTWPALKIGWHKVAEEKPQRRHMPTDKERKHYHELSFRMICEALGS